MCWSSDAVRGGYLGGHGIRQGDRKDMLWFEARYVFGTWTCQIAFSSFHLLCSGFDGGKGWW